MCGLEITVRRDAPGAKDGVVTRIRPRKEDVFSKGHICPKGTTLGQLHSDPTRLRGPVVRDGDTFREVSWDEAFATCERLIHQVVAEHGMEAVTAYIGNPAAHTFSIGRYVGVLIGMSGIPRIYSAGTVDQWPKNVTSALMYGGMWSIPVPDVQRSDFMVLMGANPQASQGSLMACANVLAELDRIRARRRQGHRHRSASDRNRAPRIRMDPHHARHRCGPALCRDQRAVRRRPGRPRPGGRPPRRRRRGSRGGHTLHARAGRRHVPDSRRADPRACPRDRGSPQRRSSTGASACATRSSARWPAGWSTSSTSSPAASTYRAG